MANYTGVIERFLKEPFELTLIQNPLLSLADWLPFLPCLCSGHTHTRGLGSLYASPPAAPQILPTTADLTSSIPRCCQRPPPPVQAPSIISLPAFYLEIISRIKEHSSALYLGSPAAGISSLLHTCSYSLSLSPTCTRMHTYAHTHAPL